MVLAIARSGTFLVESCLNAHETKTHARSPTISSGGAFSLADPLYRQILVHTPSHIEALNRVRVLIRMDPACGGVAAAAECGRTKPAVAEAQANLGHCSRTGWHEEALRAYQKASGVESAFGGRPQQHRKHGCKNADSLTMPSVRSAIFWR